MKNNLLQGDLDIDSALIQAIDVIGNKKTGIIHSFGKIFQYYDEPKFFQYYARVADPKLKLTGDHGTAAGFSFFSKKTAALKCLAEALERYSLENFDNTSITYTRATKLRKKTLDLTKVVSFSDKQRTLYPSLKLDSKGFFGWVLGKDFFSKEDIYIPAQLVYLLYKRQANESIIRMPISTGAATGTSIATAIYRGICEIIERDAFMITYLNKLPRSKVLINKSKNPIIRKIVQIAKNYNIKLYLFDISTDLEIYTFFSIAVDETGLAAAVSTGLKSSLDPIDAMIGALQEVFHPRTWIRREKDNFTGDKDIKTPISLSERGILWSQTKNIKQLNFLLRNNATPIPVEDYVNKSKGDIVKDLAYITSVFKEKNYHIYYVDITPKIQAIQKSNFRSVMVIIPELQPLYLDERFRYLGGKRLYEIPIKLGYLKKAKAEEDLNSFPHPFL